MVEGITLEIGVLLLFQTAFIVWGGRQVVSMMRQGLTQLDANIAAALKKIIEEGIGDFEPPNPILQAIASRLSQNPALEVLEVREQDETGRFV